MVLFQQLRLLLTISLCAFLFLASCSKGTDSFLKREVWRFIPADAPIIGGVENPASFLKALSDNGFLAFLKAPKKKELLRRISVLSFGGFYPKKPMYGFLHPETQVPIFLFWVRKKLFLETIQNLARQESFLKKGNWEIRLDSFGKANGVGTIIGPYKFHFGLENNFLLVSVSPAEGDLSAKNQPNLIVEILDYAKSKTVLQPKPVQNFGKGLNPGPKSFFLLMNTEKTNSISGHAGVQSNWNNFIKKSSVIKPLIKFFHQKLAWGGLYGIVGQDSFRFNLSVDYKEKELPPELFSNRPTVEFSPSNYLSQTPPEAEVSGPIWGDRPLAVFYSKFDYTQTKKSLQTQIQKEKPTVYGQYFKTFVLAFKSIGSESKIIKEIFEKINNQCALFVFKWPGFPLENSPHDVALVFPISIRDSSSAFKWLKNGFQEFSQPGGPWSLHPRKEFLFLKSETGQGLPWIDFYVGIIKNKLIVTSQKNRFLKILNNKKDRIRMGNPLLEWISSPKNQLPENQSQKNHPDVIATVFLPALASFFRGGRPFEGIDTAGKTVDLGALFYFHGKNLSCEVLRNGRTLFSTWVIEGAPPMWAGLVSHPWVGNQIQTHIDFFYQ